MNKKLLCAFTTKQTPEAYGYGTRMICVSQASLATLSSPIHPNLPLALFLLLWYIEEMFSRFSHHLLLPLASILTGSIIYRRHQIDRIKENTNSDSTSLFIILVPIFHHLKS